MSTDRIPVNSPYAWILAARPKTLTAAAVPVMIGGSLSIWENITEKSFQYNWIVLLLCFLFAFVMQINANFINDYFDFKKGSDDENRLGPRRACAMGWITPAAMQRAIVITTIAGCLLGLPLLIVGSWPMLIIGILCVIFCFLYTTHLSYWGLGDLLVIVFFGLIPVCTTYYLQVHSVPKEVIVASISCGLITDTLLVVNNYRDREGDKENGKKTFAVRFGERATRFLYFLLGLIGCHSCLIFNSKGMYATSLIPFVYMFLHVASYNKMSVIKKGKALNKILGETARNIFVFGLLFTLGVIIDILINI